MALIVQKYGGTSVGDAERIQAVADRIVTFRDAGNQVVVVVSAMSGETNRLETLGQSIVKKPLDREMDVLLASGEQVTIALLSMALHERGCLAKSYLGDQVCIRTDGNFGKARIRDIDTKGLKADIEAGITPVIAGFQGVDESGNVNTLGRGGRLSDGWGYNYVGYLCYDMVAEKPLYRGHIEKTLRNLAKPLYESYPWEGKSIDGYADSIEGALYVLNRLPVPEGFAWVDREMANHVTRSSEPLETANLWGTMKLESNGVRTVILARFVLRSRSHRCGVRYDEVIAARRPAVDLCKTA